MYLFLGSYIWVHSTTAVSFSIVCNVKMHLNYEVRSQIVLQSSPVFRTGLQLFCTDKYVKLLSSPSYKILLRCLTSRNDLSYQVNTLRDTILSVPPLIFWKIRTFEQNPDRIRTNFPKKVRNRTKVRKSGPIGGHCWCSPKSPFSALNVPSNFSMSF